jgi:hypothetical protein
MLTGRRKTPKTIGGSGDIPTAPMNLAGAEMADEVH